MSSDFLLRHLATVNADLENKEKGTSGRQARSDSKGTGKRKTSNGSSAEKRYFISHIHMLSPYTRFSCCPLIDYCFVIVVSLDQVGCGDQRTT